MLTASSLGLKVRPRTTRREIRLHCVQTRTKVGSCTSGVAALHVSVMPVCVQKHRLVERPAGTGSSRSTKSLVCRGRHCWSESHPTDGTGGDSEGEEEDRMWPPLPVSAGL